MRHLADADSRDRPPTAIKLPMRWPARPSRRSKALSNEESIPEESMSPEECEWPTDMGGEEVVRRQVLKEANAIWGIKLVSCVVVMVLGNYCMLRLAVADSYTNKENDDSGSSTYAFWAVFNNVFSLFIIAVNMLAVLLKRSSGKLLIASVVAHTLIRLAQLATYPRPLTDFADTYLVFMQWDRSGVSCFLVHATMGFYGYHGRMGCGGEEFTSMHAILLLSLAGVRMTPSFVLSVASGNAHVLERALLVNFIPTLLTFWFARGIEVVGNYIYLSVSQITTREEELLELRSRCEQLERARRNELEGAEMSRLRKEREDAEMEELSMQTPKLAADWATRAEDGPHRLPSPLDSAVGLRVLSGGTHSGSMPSWVMPSGPVFRAPRVATDSVSDESEGLVRGGSLFAALSRGDVSSVAHLKQQ